VNTKIQTNVVKRWQGNPIIKAEDLPGQGGDVHNAGAVRFKDEYILLLTVEAAEGYYNLYRARSRDGLDFTIDPEPVMRRSDQEPFATYERDGVLDPRITYLEGTYYIVYGALSPYGYCLGLARTDDFETIERMALISEPDTKGGALFPERIDGRYALLTRPAAGESIWICYSDDLHYWGGFRPVMTPRGGYWDFHRIGTGPPPILTDKGWLLIYYGERFTSGGALYRLGSAVLDRHNPWQVIGRSNISILSPYESYERIGDVGNLVFSCGMVVEEETATIRIYYGAARSCICLGTVSIAEACARCFKES